MLTVITSATDRKLASVGDLQADIPGLSDDDAGKLLDQASAAIESYCGRVFAVETVEEVLRLDARAPVVICERRPIVSVVSIAEAGQPLGEGDYEVDMAAGLLRRLSSDVPIHWCAAKVVVRYAAGFSTIPKDVARAALSLATAIHARKGEDPSVRSETVDGVRSVSYFDPGNGGGAIPEAVRGLIDPYAESSL